MWEEEKLGVDRGILLLLVAVGLLFGGTSSASGRMITVDDDGPADFNSIQAAIGDSNDGDVIIVFPGKYYENINFNGKNITARSVDPNDPEVVNNTIIDGSQPVNPDNGSVVTFANGEDRNSILQGFTITGGTGTWYNSANHWAGGIFCNGGSPVISHNIIAANNGGHRGGGVYTRNSNPLLLKNKIMNNSASRGGAIYMQSSTEFYDNTVCHNNASRGGGLYIRAGGVTVANNLIYANNATFAEAGGIKVHSCSPIITGNTIVGNSCVKDGAANLSINFSDNVPITNNIITNGLNGPGVYLYSSSVIFKYNNVWSNEGGNYEGIPDQTGLNGNISENPLFVNSDSNDFHLQATSPCIDAGDPEFAATPVEKDIDDQPRLINERVDIGADEYPGNVGPVANAGPDQLISDIPSLITLDGSGSSDLENDDLTYHWQQLEGPGVDLNDLNVVNPTFVPLEFGIYVFQLVVNDGWTDSLPDTVGVVIGNKPPVADAGPDRYAGYQGIILDGTGSYDPEGYGVLSYQWHQISGPTLQIADANTATPTISGFTQTSSIQECEFELVVSDGDLTSLGDTVEVIIVPDTGDGSLRLSGIPFDLNKPTIIYFGGGNCADGAGGIWGGDWRVKANFIIPQGSGIYNGYSPPYKKWGDKLIVYLSSVAPDYKQPIQTMGYSTGNVPAIDVANHLNSTYSDPRYAVNRVTFLDAACRSDYSGSINAFLRNPVDGEQCWIDNYIATHSKHYSGTLNITFPGGDHGSPSSWVHDSQYGSSWPGNDMYNGGITAGFYCSVAGPAKNMQLAADTSKYYFRWINSDPDYLVARNSSYPGRLPEPVTLSGPNDGAFVDANGAVLSCEVSRNSVGYQVLLGPDSYSMDFAISDTAGPPADTITTFPFEQTWWTVKARDQYGTTIFADPILINAEDVAPPIDNPDGGEYLTCTGYELVSTEVISPNECEYHFRMKIKNMTHLDVERVLTKVTGTPANMLAVNDTLFFYQPVGPGQEAASENVLVVRTDCQSPADVDEVSWRLSRDFSTDSDGDGIPDGWEIDNGLLAWQADGQADPDGDSLTNLEEYLNGCDPHNPDTDGDGLTDFEEVTQYGTNPLLPDTDGDGLTDFEEVIEYGTNPFARDTDADGLTDLEEVVLYHTNPLSADTDSDGMPDKWEILNALNPFADDSQDDIDNDGLSNIEEHAHGCNPHNSDTDHDSMPDGWEVLYQLNPLQDDADVDSDGDGYSNIIEFMRHGKPNDANSLPPLLTFLVPTDIDSVQLAVDGAINGDTIVIEPGTYYETIDLAGKRLMVRSIDPNDPNVVAATIIDGAGQGSVVTFGSGEDAGCVLAGLTITGGEYGVYCQSSAPAIINCILSKNQSVGIYIVQGNPTVTDCTVVENSSGVSCRDSDPTFVNCTVARNTGMGILLSSLRDTHEAVIVNCSVVANTGIGIQSRESLTEISNCLVAANAAGGIFLVKAQRSIITGCTITQNLGNGLHCQGRGRTMITNCIVSDNLLEQLLNVGGALTVAYSDIEGGWLGAGNIDTDPCFASLGYWADVNDPNIVVEPNHHNAVWVEGDYHLLPASTCIDAGDNNSLPPDTADLDGDGNTTELIPFDLDANPRIADGNKREDGSKLILFCRKATMLTKSIVRVY
jgi:parallel beta-helix repeat protein